MDIISIILIALGLSMDAFAVSVTSGFTVKESGTSHALRMAIFFGGFQAIMPILGWLAGFSFINIITTSDHWIAFGLLAFIGLKMIYESRKLREEKNSDPFALKMLFVLAVATSIDALAVGIGLSCLNVAIITPSIIIGVITFLMSFAGIFIGKKFGHFFERKLELAGGLVLIGIGIKILVQHLGGAA